MRLIIALTLFGFWLVLSGHYEAWLVAFGAGCAAAVALFGGHLGIADTEGHPIRLLPRALLYWIWLAKEMVASALQVARLIVDPSLPIAPVLVRVKASQRTAVGLTTFANSITLTPGTISVEASSRRREILVHAITRQTAAGLADGAMDRRVRQLEGKSA
jgi:multicomponent Na+:H+ antiporter subunit E